MSANISTLFQSRPRQSSETYKQVKDLKSHKFIQEFEKANEKI